MKIFSKLSIIALLAVLLFNGCKKNAINYSDFEYVSPDQARVKINYNVAFYNNPATQIKINGVRVSATIVTTRYPFPGGGFNTGGGNFGDYLPVNPGANEISVSIPKRGTNIDSIEVYKTTMNMAAGKHYSLHIADTLERKGLPVEEDVTRPDSGFVRYRFTNLMANVPAMDLYIGTVKVAENIPFMGISAPFTLPTSQVNISSTWTIRPAGALPTSTALATYNSASTLLSSRVYTVFATGYAGNTGARLPYVSFYYVR
ncbi:DUF4397 domain-containing protein [Pedobacter sp. Du54]|uniref:DUF4397 domain-containing protein n=1 Tax=Pedobacter anseongensis TaxID=3133439 RepID=UPI0030ABE4F9